MKAVLWWYSDDGGELTLEIRDAANRWSLLVRQGPGGEEDGWSLVCPADQQVVMGTGLADMLRALRQVSST